VSAGFFVFNLQHVDEPVLQTVITQDRPVRRCVRRTRRGTRRPSSWNQSFW